MIMSFRFLSYLQHYIFSNTLKGIDANSLLNTLVNWCGTKDTEDVSYFDKRPFLN